MSVLSDRHLSDLYPEYRGAIGPAEEWRAIDGYEGRYQVSSFGNVRSIGKGKNGRLGQPLKPARLLRNGAIYVQVALYLNGIRRYIKVHHLVLMAFVGPRPYRQEVNHGDGNGENNHLDNLEYTTRPENLKHAFRTGLMSNKGERNPAARLTADQARDIYRRFHEGQATGVTLAREFGVSPSTISNIAVGKHWRSACAS